MSVVGSTVVSMTTTRAGLAEAEVITRARAFHELAVQAAAGQLATAVEWAEDHPALFDAEAAQGTESGRPLAGPGAPLVAEFAVVQFATVLGLTSHGGRSLIGDALELKHRLPRTWARVQALEVPAWRARRLAEDTRRLTLEAAAWVDAQLAPFLHALGWAQQERTVAAAIDRFMPEEADRLRAQAADGRFVDIDVDQCSFTGTATIRGELDLPDALDLDGALAQGAALLHRLGSTETLDVRRAQALGEMSRRQLALGLEATPTSTPGSEASPQPPADPAAQDQPPSRPRAGTKPTREAVLYLHLDPTRQRGWSENHGTRLLTAETIREWLDLPGAQITVRPVIDLNEHRTTDGYVPTPMMREQAILIRPTCAFPLCNSPARRADLDHIIAFSVGGRTTTINLAPLCRAHHRVKTHGGWTYRQLAPGVYHWTDPLGFGYRVDQHGTTQLTRRLLPPLDELGKHPPDD